MDEKLKLGYPCQNWTLGCVPNRTFRLASFSEQKFLETVENNLSALQETLDWNVKNNFLFFRISSDTIPFASHPINKVPWQKHFHAPIRKIGDFIRKNKFRISMHPDQFVLINTPKEDVLKKSLRDLVWHAELLDLMGLDNTAKIQIHVGGVYGDKPAALKRFIQNYKTIPDPVKSRLVIENDDRLFDLRDCLTIHESIGIPVLFDNFHHECLNNKETLKEGFRLASATWTKKDGVLMTDFSHQAPQARRGKHTESIDLKIFEAFLKSGQDFEFDVMLEIKDKEKSALKARSIIEENKP